MNWTKSTLVRRSVTAASRWPALDSTVRKMLQVPRLRYSSSSLATSKKKENTWAAEQLNQPADSINAVSNIPGNFGQPTEGDEATADGTNSFLMSGILTRPEIEMSTVSGRRMHVASRFQRIARLRTTTSGSFGRILRKQSSEVNARKLGPIFRSLIEKKSKNPIVTPCGLQTTCFWLPSQRVEPWSGPQRSGSKSGAVSICAVASRAWPLYILPSPSVHPGRPRQLFLSFVCLSRRPYPELRLTVRR